MEQRIRFIIMVQDNLNNFAAACRVFGISRKTGYKWWKRYELGSSAALVERSRRPHFSPNATLLPARKRILRVKQKWPHWGPKKIRSYLMSRNKDGKLPASSTIGRILESAGLVRRGRKRRLPGPLVTRPGLTEPGAPNDVWAVDFKGWFRLGNGERCEPLTVSDLRSRFLLACVGNSDVSYEQARPVFELLFKTHGQPSKIRVDNGPPFGSRGAAGLGRLAVWWVSLGIEPEFIAPGHPEQNGSHERMHRTLKAEAVEPIAYHRRAQQKKLDRWRWEFNYERPHEALGQVTPASLYTKSKVPYTGPLDPIYPEFYVHRRVRTTGEIRWAGGLRFIGEAFVGQTLGLFQISPGKHRVYFHLRLLGEINEGEQTGMRPAVCISSTTKKKPKTRKGVE